MPLRCLHPHITGTFPETYHLRLLLYSKQQMPKKRQKPPQQMKNPFGERICAQGSVPRLNQPFVFGWNINWCFYLYSSGSGEQLWVLMWVKNVPYCKSFHIPSHGRNNRCVIPGSGVLLCFYCMKYGVWNFKWHHLFGILIQSSFQLNYYKIYQQLEFFIVMGKWFPAQKRNNRNRQPFVSLSHSCLVFTADVEVVALNSSANFPT